MIRTPIYLPKVTYATLSRLAKEKGITFSNLIRQCADAVIKKTTTPLSPKRKLSNSLPTLPKKYQVKLSKPTPVLIRKDRT